MTPPITAEPAIVGQRETISQFLGQQAAAGDWPSLLGLDAETFAAADIIPALQRQLTRITDHPAALSSEADEIRLLLHAGAARLLEMRSRRGGESGRGAGGGDDFRSALLLTMAMHGGWNRRSLQQLTRLAQSAGIAPAEFVQILEDLTRGRSNTEAHATTSGPTIRPAGPASNGYPASIAGPGIAPNPFLNARRAGGPAASPSAPQPASAPAVASAPGVPRADELQEHQEPVRGGAPLAAKVAIAIVGGLAVMVAVSIVLVAVLMTSPNPGDPAAGGVDSGGQALADATADAKAGAPTQSPPRRELFPAPSPGDASAPPSQPPRDARPDLRREATAVLAELAIDPQGGLARFEEFVARLSRAWPELAADEQVAVTSSVIEFLYRASIRPELGARAVDAVTAGAVRLGDPAPLAAEDVLRGVWSMGMSARLTRERDLPVTVSGRLLRATNQAATLGVEPSELSFRGGAQAALTIAAMRLTPVPPAKPDRTQLTQAWAAWRSAAESALGASSPERQRTLLAALETLMTTGPEATADEAVFEVVQNTATAISWRSGEESRQWLLRWLTTPGISSGDLHALTAALATRSAAPGIDLSFVVSAGATSADRAALRDRYATVWGLGAGQRREAYTAWVDAASARIASTEPKHPIEHLGRSLVFARINGAARALWRGAPVAAQLATLDLATSLQDRVSAVATQKPPPAGPAAAGAEGEWAVRYLAAGQNIPVRRELLQNLNRRPSTVEAEVLVAEACRGAPAQVRADANAIVRRYAGEPEVVAAMLEFAPLIPQTLDNASLIEYVAIRPLPPIRDENWRVAVRRALVERVLEVGSRETEQTVIDQIASAMLAAYLSEVDAPLPPGDPELVDRLIAAAQKERESLQREAAALAPTGREPLSLAEATSRRGPRLAAAEGPVQRFAAEQASMAELLAYVVAAEQPGHAAQVREVLDTLSQRRRESSHIFEQMHAAESAMTKLWLIRVGGDQPS